MAEEKATRSATPALGPPKMPFRGLVVGASGSGKTYTVVDTILQHWLPKSAGGPLRRLIWLAPKRSLEQPKVKLLGDVFQPDELTLIDGSEGWTKAVQDAVNKAMMHGRRRNDAGDYPADVLLIIDDMLAATKRAKYVANLYTTARHLGVSILELTQRIFAEQAGTRTQRLNCTAFWLGGFPGGLSEVKHLLQQLETKEAAAALFERYRATLKKSPHNYLYADLLQPESSPARWRDSSLENGIEL